MEHKWPQIRSNHKADTNYIYIKELGLKYIHNSHTLLYIQLLSVQDILEIGAIPKMSALLPIA